MLDNTVQRFFFAGLVLCFTGCITGKEPGGPPDGGAVPEDGEPRLDRGKQDGKKDGAKQDGAKQDSGKQDSGSGPHGTFVLVKPGTFSMGAAHQEYCSETIREARHQVTLTRKFEIQQTEVTQKQFSTLMGYNPSRFVGTDANSKSDYCGGTTCDNNPAEKVSWHEAAYYCNKLSERLGYKARCYDCTGALPKVSCVVHWTFSSAGKSIFDCPAFRLPSEAEWEYAYRAGTKTAFYNGDNLSVCYSCSTVDPRANAIAWYCQNAGDRTHGVAKRQPNPWGLSDMAGNVEEWTQDWYTESLGTTPQKDPLNTSAASYRVTRGGRFDGHPRELRAAFRYRRYPTNNHYQVGFRPVRTVP